MAVKGQNVDSGMMGPQVGRSRGNPSHDVNFVEGSSKRSTPAHVVKACSGHALSSSSHPAKSIANSAAGNRSRKNQAGAHGPNVQLQGQAMPHADVQTAPGKALGKMTRQGRNTYGPNIQFQGAAHRHDQVKTSGA
jgi:hypothetical protein